MQDAPVVDVTGLEEDEGDDQPLDPNLLVPSGDPVSNVLVQLTAIVGQLTKKKGDSLDEAMDSLGASGLLDQPAGLARKHTALIAALKKSFKENPKKLWEIIEGNMADEFDLRTSQPNIPGLSFTARGWAEHRSRIMGYPRTVRSA